MKSNAIVDRINSFVNLLPKKTYDRPQKKFIRELIAGIFIAQSTIMTEICRALSGNNKSFKASYKRLGRRLGEVDLTPAMAAQQTRALREIQDDTVIAIDIGDVAKPNAKVMECLGKVADGSDKHKIKPGYWLISAVAVNPRLREKTPEPLELKMWSSESEQFLSENDVLKQTISFISLNADYRGIHVIDRGGDRGIILNHYFDMPEQKFIIRMNNRHLTNTDSLVTWRTGRRARTRSELSFESAIQRESAMHDRKRAIMHLRYDYEPVKVTAIKGSEDHKLFLITAWNETSARPMELLTSIPITSSEQALQIVINYLSRWSVEETYRFLKTGSGLEGMRYFSYGALQNITKACFIVASLLARMAKFSSWQALFCRVALRVKDAPNELYNWFYRASDACAKLLKRHLSELMAHNEPVLHNRRRRGPYQPSLFPEEVGL